MQEQGIKNHRYVRIGGLVGEDEAQGDRSEKKKRTRPCWAIRWKRGGKHNTPKRRGKGNKHPHAIKRYGHVDISGMRKMFRHWGGWDE